MLFGQENLFRVLTVRSVVGGCTGQVSVGNIVAFGFLEVSGFLREIDIGDLLRDGLVARCEDSLV